MKILVLDDDLDRHADFAARFAAHDVTACHNAVEAIESLDALGTFDLVHLDHDLDPDFRSNAPNGLVVAEYIAAMPEGRRPRAVVIHSWNPSGAWRMAKALRSCGIEAIYKPFGGLNPANEALRNDFAYFKARDGKP
jgi:CheY-like chemotaxis protein